MNVKNYIFSFVILLCIQSCSILSVETVTLSPNATTKVFDRATGYLYLGLDESSDLPAIIRFARFYGQSVINTETIVMSSNSLISGNAIEFLTLATSKGNVDPLLAVVAKNGSNPHEQTTVLAYSSNFPNDDKKAESNELKDASGNDNEGGATTAGIVTLAASNSYIFAAVRPSGGDFGANNSGVAAVKVTNNDTITLEQTNAEIGGTNTQKAKKVDTTTEELKINNDPIIISQEACLHWDETLKRLYIGMNGIQTNAIDANPAGTRSIIVARVNTNGSMTFEEIAPASVFLPDAANQIVGAIQANSTKPQLTIGALYLRTMHTSTGKSYLIAVGGNAQNGTTTVPGNRIFALPLVDVKDSTNITQGTLANVNNATFMQPATAPDEIFTSKNLTANVGDGPFALLPDKKISDIVVVGDAVYVSVPEVDQSNDNETGIWYSQALFDEEGVIYRWTPWTKRAFPLTTSITGIQFFDVDAFNGKLWAVDENTSKLHTTQWNRTQDAESNSLLEILNRDFACGCFSMLDLDQSTRGLGQESPTRYTLFGGVNQVAFIRISTSRAETAPYDRDTTTNTQYVQDVIIDKFNEPQNYLLTKLPVCSGCVKVLEFARTFTTNYFFAGTQKGLYVFTNRTGQAFVLDETVNYLNEEPFFSRRWQQAPNISGSIVDIKSDGNSLYVLTFETSKEKPIKNCVYRIPFADTLENMFDSENIKKVAESALEITNSDLSAAKMFFALQIMITKVNDDLVNELVLATNNGIYTSNGISTATNQEQAAWQPVDVEDTSMYNGMFAVDNIPTFDNISTYTHVLSTVWPIQVADEKNCLTFEKSNIRQLNGSLSPGKLPTFIPENFNATPSGNFDIDEIFKTFNPISYFWSDGARRFFIIQRSCDPHWINKIYVIPYDIREWNVTDPDKMTLKDPALKQIKTFYWVKPIGATGILMAGTGSGVVTLD